MKVPFPLILRGTDTASGSAQLVVITALRQPAEVLCSAPSGRLREMFDEVLAVIAATGVEHTVRSNPPSSQVAFPNGSRILFRTPRRDGKGIQGVKPAVVWLDQADRFAEIEAIDQVKRSTATVGIEAIEQVKRSTATVGIEVSS